VQKEMDAGELAWRVAGVREVFEECGLLISRPPLSSSPPEAKQWRERSAQDSTHFLRMFTDRDNDDNAGLRDHLPGLASPTPCTTPLPVRLTTTTYSHPADTEALVPWAHWVTPLEEKWRYDTRFYLSVLSQPYDHAQTDARVGLLSPSHCSLLIHECREGNASFLKRKRNTFVVFPYLRYVRRSPISTGLPRPKPCAPLTKVPTAPIAAHPHPR
jgi:8-oxo-dGTP pyrophosphatase MutT (NUDIX family)